MGSIRANISLGRAVEFYERVRTNDPANSALIMGVIVSGGDPLATLADYDTVTDVFSGASVEAAVGGYARKTMTNVDLSAWTPDDSLNRIVLTLPTQAFSPNTGETWDIAFIAYDNDTTGGTDANLVPISFHELRIDGTPIPTLTGSNIVIDFSSAWILET